MGGGPAAAAATLVPAMGEEGLGREGEEVPHTWDCREPCRACRGLEGSRAGFSPHLPVELAQPLGQGLC